MPNPMTTSGLPGTHGSTRSAGSSRSTTSSGPGGAPGSRIVSTDATWGWETPLEAAARFDAAVMDHATEDSPLVIGSHGMVLTAWLVHARGAVARHAAGEFWDALAFPDVVEVDGG